MLELEKIVEGLRRVDWDRLGVDWAVLFGSLARRGSGRDVDLLVMPRGEGFDPVDAAVEIAEALGLDASLVDVVDARRAPCPVILEAWRRGIYIHGRALAREWLLARVWVCYDYAIAKEKLGITSRALQSMEARWGGGGGH